MRTSRAQKFREIAEAERANNATDKQRRQLNRQKRESKAKAKATRREREKRRNPRLVEERQAEIDDAVSRLGVVVSDGRRARGASKPI